MKHITPILLLLATGGLSFATDDLETRSLPLPNAPTDQDYLFDGSPSEARVELGRMLFFDKLLSGNRNISCATCHHPTLSSGDGVALAFGEGASGLGGERSAGKTEADAVYERVPRNAPALFNLGAREFTVLFHDGRVELDTEGNYESGFITPAKWKFPEGLENTLAAQAMFPLSSPTEMAGQKGENEVANAVSLNNVAGRGGVWQLVAQRLRDNPEYVALFRAAFPEQVETGEEISYVLAANAIASFESVAFRADDSPFDRYLRGTHPLPDDAQRGMELFYGKAGCHSCHSGPFQTDHDFHAIAMPQIGPGKSDGWNSSYWSETGIKAFPEDHGRGRVTIREEDKYKFRTPSLRNVELTGPWGHSGAYRSLEAVVRHHLDPVASLHAYELDADLLPPVDEVLEQTASGSRLSTKKMDAARRERYLKRDTWVHSNDELREEIAKANELDAVELTDAEVADLLRFLESLTDDRSRDLTSWVPDRVPSGLPVED